MGRNLPASEKRLVFTLRSDNGWSHSEIGAHFGKSKSWAIYILATYSEESLSPKIVQKRGRKRKTDEVEDGVIIGMAKHLYKESYEKLAVVLNNEISAPISSRTSANGLSSKDVKKQERDQLGQLLTN